MTNPTTAIVDVSHTVGREVAGDQTSTAPITAIVVGLLLIGAMIAVLVLAVQASGRRKLVLESSAALRQLHELNVRSRTQLLNSPRISHAFRYRAESKGKFDRFDLAKYLATSILEHEEYFELEVTRRVRAVELHSAYIATVERESRLLLTKSSHPKIDQARFVNIERKLFDRTLLPSPIPSAHITATISYTSPKGQNSYSRALTWNFNALRDGLQSAQAVRARQSTAAALRARERSLMTLTLRSDILRRDSYRCRMCGAAGADGVELHVDHILPVSRGGRTLAENLQTLCAPCNLGKGNRFIG